MTFDEGYEAAKKYSGKYGNLLVPKKYITSTGKNLGKWINVQRQKYQERKLSEEQVEKLEAIGMIWVVRYKNDFQKMLNIAQIYQKEHGNLLVPVKYVAPTGEALGQWIHNRRAEYKNGTLTKEKIEALESIGMTWQIVKRNDWDEMFEQACNYKRKHGDLLVNVKYVTVSGKPLGNWINWQRKRYKKGKLSKEQIEKLESIGMVWKVKLGSDWEEMYNLAIQYRMEHGNLLVSKTSNNKSLGIWLRKQRHAYMENTLSHEQIEKLEKIGLVWKIPQHYSWSYMYKLAEEYFKTHGNLLITRSYVAENGEHLGRWIATRRCEYMAGTLTKDKQEKLERIGMVWQLVEHDWDKKFAKARAYYIKHGHLLTIKINLSKEDENLLIWLREQRYMYKKGELSEERIKKLESIGMKFDADYKEWYQMFKVAENYYQKYGHLDVPCNHITSGGKNLGSWIRLQRQLYNNKELSKEEIENLNTIGMIWQSKKEISWDEMYKLAEEYFLQHGNLDIPKDYVASNNERLGSWLETQRQLYKTNRLSKDKLDKLESIGMIWGTPRDAWNEMFKLAKKNYEKYGHLDMSKDNATFEGEILKNWIIKQCKLYKMRKLSEDQVEKLNSIGMIWEVSKKLDWDEMYSLAKTYYLQHGDLNIPENYNGELEKWLKQQQQLYRTSQLTKDKQEKLESIGIVWQEKICINWDEMYKLAKDYYLRFGDLAVSRNYITKNGENLGKWIISNRHAYISGNLLSERIQKLEAIGMIWHVRSTENNVDTYLKELPVTIDKEINKNILKYISLIEFKTKIRFLSDIGVSPVDEKGKLIDIFTMSNHDIEEKYGVNIESLIKYYKRDFSRKLHL